MAKQSKKQYKNATKKTAANKVRGTCRACGRVVELPNHKGRCECGQGLIARGGRVVRIKETPHGCLEMNAAKTISEAPAKAPEKAKTSGKATRQRTDGKMSGLDAAAQVLAEAGEPLSCQEIVKRMLEKGLWETQGRTPHATIYSGLLRDLQKNGEASRFRKVGKGRFTVAK